MIPPVTRPVILAGGFERHNFGDLLMGRIMEVCLREHGLTPVFASLLPADLRGCGGSWVHAFADLAPFLGPDTPIVHVGGETIPCPFRDGLRMNVPVELPAKLASALAREINPTGLEDRAFSYLTPPRETIRGREHVWRKRFFHAQGAFTLGRAESAVISGVNTVLKDAAWLTARENASVAALRAAGLPESEFAWDSGVLVPCLEKGGTANLETAPPAPRRGGVLLVHANAAFLAEHGPAFVSGVAAAARDFDRVEVALAGVAANHDTPESARELVRSLEAMGVGGGYCGDLHAEAIVARIRGASCVVSTSLHYRIMALTHAVPRVSLKNEKVSTWARDCDAGFPHDVAPAELADAVFQALAVPAEATRETALSARREAFRALTGMADAVAAAADSPDASFTLPADYVQGGAMLPSSFPPRPLFPAEWIFAMSAQAAAAGESKKEIRRLKEELKSARAELSGIKKSVAWKLLRPFRSR